MDASDLPHPPPDESRTPARATSSESGARGRRIQSLCSIGLSVLLVLTAGIGITFLGDVPAHASSRTEAFAGSFSFGAAGDYGFDGNGQAVMTAMGSSGLDFIIALGDLSYGDTTEAEWCAYFEGRVGDGRALLISGNHDSGESSGGDINTYRLHCNFGISATMTGDYAKEYYFDYPASGPLARFILTACGLDLDGASWACVPGEAHYAFLSTAIDGARAAGIPWVIVGMHKPCISNGGKSCDIGEDLQDLLLYKKVDLVLQGHEHAYLRTHPLVCADDDLFRPECLAPSGAWGQIIAIAGTGGTGHDDLGGTPDEPYFAQWNGDTFGFLKVDVSESTLDARFVPVNGTYTDSFGITRAPPTPDFALSANPMGLALAPDQPGFVTVRVDAVPGFAESVTLQISAPAEVTGSCVPSSLRAGETSTCTLSGRSPGAYDVTIAGTSGSLVRSRTVSLSIAEPSPGPDSTPPLIAIERPADAAVIPVGPVTVSGKASDDRGLRKVELSVDGLNWTLATGTNSWSGRLTLPAGEQRIHARATDEAGNEGQTVVRVFADVPTAAPSGGFLGVSWPEWSIYAAMALAAGLIGSAVGSLMRRRREGRPPSQ